MGLLRAIKRFFVGEPAPCEVCGALTREVFCPGAPRGSQLLCRAHLLDAAFAAFANFEFRTIVCQPHLVKSAGTMFPFYPVDEMEKEFSFPKGAVAKVRSLLTTIDGNHCAECGTSAWNLYFAEVEYDGAGQRLEDLDSARGEYLCATHAFARIRPALLGNAQLFREGIWAPYLGEGIYLSTFL